MKRTVAEAHRAFDDVLPRLSDYQANEGRQALQELDQHAANEADEFTKAREEEALALRDEALKALTEARDGFESLSAEGSEGRIAGTDYAARMHELKERQDTAEAKLARATEIADGIEGIEADPVAWFSELQKRMPHLRTMVPW